MSLQFQDMVTQLLGHVGRRLELVDEILLDEQKMIGVLGSHGEPTLALATLAKICEHVEPDFRKKLVLFHKKWIIILLTKLASRVAKLSCSDFSVR